MSIAAGVMVLSVTAVIVCFMIQHVTLHFYLPTYKRSQNSSPFAAEYSSSSFREVGGFVRLFRRLLRQHDLLKTAKPLPSTNYSEAEWMFCARLNRSLGRNSRYQRDNGKMNVVVRSLPSS
ncbi:hypothetical protein BV20DRAFT_1053505 [Pilatotrama ljubarskyi]|nr:hypothetical protein BV20DRAFT_1053505 [Pilatotrama ljubarskyi]